MVFIADVIGVCKTVNEVTRLTTKSNREVSKRTVNLMDMSGKLVTVTLWGEEVRLHMKRGRIIVKWKEPLTKKDQSWAQVGENNDIGNIYNICEASNVSKDCQNNSFNWRDCSARLKISVQYEVK